MGNNSPPAPLLRREGGDINRRSMNWDDLIDFYDWEFDLICDKQKEDVHFWLEMAEIYGGPILELGAGTGRITHHLLEKGFQVTALDKAPKFLKVLRSRYGHYPNLDIVQDDMQKFTRENAYKFCFIPYSSFQYLLTLEDQIQTLRNIHKSLQTGGILGIDLCPDTTFGLIDQPKIKLYQAINPATQKEVSMFTSHHINIISNTKYWHDTYVSINKKGKKEQFNHEVTFKGISFDHMRLLLTHCGFTLINVYGSFAKDELDDESYNMLFIAKKEI